MKLKAFKKIFLNAAVLALTTFVPMAQAADHDIIILHTNDIHCGVNDNITLARVAAYKKALLQTTPNVIWADAGDFIQGAPIGKLSTGEALIKIGNVAGFDFNIPGNHEFDYGMKRFLELAPQMQSGYYSSNFQKQKQLILPPYKIFNFEGTKVALVGVTTPETLTSSDPANFKNANGDYIYSFAEDTTGKKLYKAVQKAVNKAKKQGAKYVFVVGHLGIDGSQANWNSPALAKNTTGITGFIDGHSHEKYDKLIVQNKKGQSVFITQSGTKLNNLGKITIHTNGNIAVENLHQLNKKDPATEAIVQQEMDKYAALLAQPIGEALVPLMDTDTNGTRIVRNANSNLGDFTADAYKAVLDTDIAVINGGALRGAIPQGTVAYNTFLTAFPFGNMCSSIEVTGQQILDALEVGAMEYPHENGGFLHVAGLTYTINATLPSSVKLDEKGNFIGVAGDYRVCDVMVGDTPLDLAKTYSLAGSSYILKSGGNGMSMFKGCKILKDAVISDIDIIIEYLQNYLDAKIPTKYAKPEGRINFLE